MQPTTRSTPESARSKPAALAQRTDLSQLSRREFQILARLAEGDSYKEIASRLGISVQTVNDHIKSMYRKLDVHSRGQAAVQYLKSAPH